MATIIAQLTITLDNTGNLQVTGSLEQTMLGYGMLEVAKDVIRNTAVAMQNRVQPAGVGDLALIKGGQKQS